VPANRLRRSLTATIALPAILMGTATIALLWQSHRQMSETDWVEHTDRVMLLAQTAKSEFLAAQNALGGLLISPDPGDRASLQDHFDKSDQIVKQLAVLTADNPVQEQRLIALSGLQNEWLDATRAADSVHTDNEKRELESRANAIGSNVQDEFGAMSAEEERLRVVRDARRDSQYRILTLAIPIAALILGSA